MSAACWNSSSVRTLSGSRTAATVAAIRIVIDDKLAKLGLTLESQRLDVLDDRAERVPRGLAEKVGLADDTGDGRAERVVALDEQLAEHAPLQDRVAEVAQQLDVVREQRAIGRGRDEAGVDLAD